MANLLVTMTPQILLIYLAECYTIRRHLRKKTNPKDEMILLGAHNTGVAIYKEFCFAHDF